MAIQRFHSFLLITSGTHFSPEPFAAVAALRRVHTAMLRLVLRAVSWFRVGRPLDPATSGSDCLRFVGRDGLPVQLWSRNQYRIAPHFPVARQSTCEVLALRLRGSCRPAARRSEVS